MIFSRICLIFLPKKVEISPRFTFSRQNFSKRLIMDPVLPSCRRKPPISNAIPFFTPYLNPLPNPHPSQKLDLGLEFPFQVPIPRNLPSHSEISQKLYLEPRRHYFAIVLVNYSNVMFFRDWWDFWGFFGRGWKILGNGDRKWKFQVEI